MGSGRHHAPAREERNATGGQSIRREAQGLQSLSCIAFRSRVPLAPIWKEHRTSDIELRQTPNLEGESGEKSGNQERKRTVNHSRERVLSACLLRDMEYAAPMVECVNLPSKEPHHSHPSRTCDRRLDGADA